MPKAGTYDFPFYDLDSMIAKLNTIYEKHKSTELVRTHIAETLDMSPTGGGFSYVISSMEKYGLIETVWGGKVNITDLGKIALFASPNERKQAKNEAVSNINLFKEIFSRYGINPTEEQIRIFLRTEANVDLTKVQKIAEHVYKIYINMSNYLLLDEQPEQVSNNEPAGLVRSELPIPRIKEGTQPLVIQYQGVFIQLPPNDLEALEMAERAIIFMKGVIKKEARNQE